MKKCFVAGILHLLVLTCLPVSQTVADVPVGYGLLWESRYVSEGRDNLEEGGLLSGEIDIGWKDLVAGIWFAVGDSVSYEELNLYLEYGFEIGILEAHTGYTRLEFTADNESDNEVHFGVAYGEIPHLVCGATYTYSTGADGGFLELFVSTDISLLEGRLVVEPYLLQAIDFGYASKEHDGLNNFQAGLAIHCPLGHKSSLFCSLNHSWAQKDVENDGLGDVSWVGLGVSGQF
ncbi:MAG: hypothetical protein AB3N64_05325 [Puniceicoccaceae bacterium]